MTAMIRGRPGWSGCFVALALVMAGGAAVAQAPSTGAEALPTASLAPAPTGAPPPASPGEKVTSDAAPPVDLDELKDTLQVESEILHQRVDDAKERDFMTKVKLRTFEGDVLKHIEPPGGARLIIVHRNEMAGAYTLVGLAYTLDGGTPYSMLDSSGHLDEHAQIIVFDKKVLPGEHQLAVQYDLVGNAMGVFNYLKDMKLTLRRTYTFKVEAKKETKLVGKLSTNNGMTELYEQRPNIGFETLVTELPAEDKTDTARAADAAAAITGQKSLGAFQPASSESGGAGTPAP